MNPVIDTLLAHRSVRKFKEEPLTEEQIRTIVKAAQSAATSSFVQAYTIIGVKDKAKKEKLAELAGNQEYVAKNGHFFVFCADLFRHELAGEMEGVDVEETLESTEKFMVALVDTALAAQNAVIAAESMGLGICYIGGLRNRLPEVCELLNIPDRVLPLFGLCVGVPDQTPGQKPRLPFAHIYHEDGYETDADKLKGQLEEYNRLISDYYRTRTKGARSDRWTQQIADKMQRPSRAYMKEFLHTKKFPLH